MMQQKLIKRTIIYSICFAIAAMAAILYTASHKVIEITDVAQDEVKKHQAETNKDEKEILHLTFGQGNKNTNYLCIPLKDGIKAETISVENHYMDNELWLVFDGDYTDFYSENAITGNKEKIESGYYEKEGKTTKLKFSLTGLYEYRSILEGNALYIEFVHPREIYEKIIVIDPAGGGMEFGKTANNLVEKNITLKIAEKLKNMLDATDIKVYYTRIDDIYPAEERRIGIANDAKADMLIRIQVNADRDSKVYGTSTVYNESFFIPGFGSIELADMLEREVITSISGKAIGLVPAAEDEYVIREATVPVAAVNVGYITNAQEAILLEKEDYLDKIAEGIYNTILNYYN